MDRLLKAAVDKIAGADPDFPLDVVVVPESSADLETLTQHIEGQGGEVTSVNAESLSSRVPCGRIDRIAASDLVSSVRLMRSHRMHRR